MAGRGAAPAGFVATKHSGGTGAPPGTNTSPCQELAYARQVISLPREARPAAVKTSANSMRSLSDRCVARSFDALSLAA
jgi:hypothetical protein